MRLPVTGFSFQQKKNGFSNFSITYKREPRTSAGFTLIELLVVIAIMSLISGLILANQTKFGGQVLLQNFAYDMALSIRQAQVYGIAVQGYNANFRAGYGIHFDTSATRYILYADTNNDGKWASDGSEDKTRLNITRANYGINTLCVTPVNQSEICGLRGLEIVFERPEPDANISWTDPSGSQHTCLSGTPRECAQAARIELIAPQGQKLSVHVSENGQIAVDQNVTN